jgi:RNA polymerase-binding transcription factor DksA
MFGVKKLKADLKWMEQRIDTLYKRIEKAELLRWCDQCGEPFQQRFDHDRYELLLGMQNPEITHCKHCDEIVEKKKKAKKIAETCPEEVIKLGNRKPCKSD